GIMRNEPLQHPHRNAAQTAAFGAKPFLERFFLEGEAVEQIATIKGSRLFEFIWCGTVSQSDEPRDIDLDTVEIEHDALAVALETITGSGWNRLADDRQRLPQVGAGLHLTIVAPQQGGELLARLRPPRLQRKIGEQSTCLARHAGLGCGIA